MIIIDMTMNVIEMKAEIKIKFTRPLFQRLSRDHRLNSQFINFNVWARIYYQFHNCILFFLFVILLNCLLVRSPYLHHLDLRKSCRVQSLDHH